MWISGRCWGLNFQEPQSVCQASGLYFVDEGAFGAGVELDFSDEDVVLAAALVDVAGLVDVVAARLSFR
ncbi:hypothetical protein GCM10011410_20910 [Hoyosella rhizosphaerae]|uniref:Uncharacterized protein n=1 Tax=Hoyosella rhizosphaerae TaxID=1755582 RepID=A0A916UCP2_9ACTN|nr:hypothetical protein GCM10011410_20910 [Hoyosella rhizosphaerae]